MPRNNPKKLAKKAAKSAAKKGEGYLSVKKAAPKKAKAR